MSEVYAGLDVSDKSTHVCVVDGGGRVVWSGSCATCPETIARTLARRAPGLARAVLETGALSSFLYRGLAERGVAVTCVCARHAHGVLSARVNKSDAHDAEGLAQMARTGWYKAVRIREEGTHLDRASLKIREQLTASHRALANQLRGLLKLFGLRLGQVTTPGKRRERLQALFAQKPELREVMAPLLESLEALEVRIATLSRRLAARAAADPVTARLMSVPGVGPITALVYKTSIEDPDRFDHSRSAGAFAGLAPRRSQSGERDVTGHISRAGDPMLRSALYEAANSLLARVKRDCPLRTWGLALARTRGAKRARVAVARKLAILLHRLWASNTEFRWA
jgi:transposase